MNKVVINVRHGGFSLSDEAMLYLFEKYNVEYNKFGFVNLQRHDKRLVEVVELLGENANGRYSELKIVEIESNLYRIDEYDGFESIETPDSLEWIIIEE